MRPAPALIAHQGYAVSESRPVPVFFAERSQRAMAEGMLQHPGGPCLARSPSAGIRNMHQRPHCV